MVVAIARNGVIGDGTALPWKLSADLQRFKRLTMGNTLVMGRKTFDSIGKPLPGRTTIVLTRNPNWHFPGVLVAKDLDDALRSLPAGQIPYVVGGAEIYRIAWPYVSHLHWTRVLADAKGDTQLAPFELKSFRCVESELVPADAKNEWPSLYELWVRRDWLPASGSAEPEA